MVNFVIKFKLYYQLSIDIYIKNVVYLSMAQWLNWIEQPPPKGQVAGSIPAWVTT